MKKFLFPFFLLVPLFVSCSETKYKVSLLINSEGEKCEHCHFKKTEDIATRGHNYTVDVQLDRGYILEDEMIKITVGNFELIPGSKSYYFNASNNTIFIDGSCVSNNIKIEINECSLKESIFTITVGEGYEPLSEVSPKTKQISIDLEYKKISELIKPSIGKKVNTNISVFDSEGPLNPNKYIFNDNEDGTYTFLMDDKNEFYRDINVTIPDAINVINS